MYPDIDRRILSRLQDWEEKEGPLPTSLVLYRDLLQFQQKAGSRVSRAPIRLEKEEAIGREKQGRPLLDFEDIGIDWPLFKEFCADVINISSAQYGATDALLRYIRSLAPTLLTEIVRSWFLETEFYREVMIGEIDARFFGFVTQTALKPFLTVCRDLLSSLLDQELWRRRYCPVCGGIPDFAYLSKDGTRWLVCSRCDTEWLFQRIKCPYCGNEDQSKIAFFTDEKVRYRLYVCDTCRYYLKAIDLRQSEDDVLLPLERVVTADMDIQANQKGYSVGKSFILRAN